MLGVDHLYLSWENLAGSTSESALATFTNGSFKQLALTPANFYQVTNSPNQVLVIRLIIVTFGQNGSSACNYRVRLRCGNPVTNSSPIIFGMGGGGPSNTCIITPCKIACQLEVPAGYQIGLTHLDTAANGILSVQLLGYEY